MSEEEKKEATRTLLITKKNGEEMQVKVPVGWYVTFGPVAVATSRSDGRMPMALRIYESDKNQRAIFTDIESFRDMAIPVRVKKTNVQEKEGYMECEGVKKKTTFQAVTTEWTDPDNVEDKPALLGMPKDSEIYGLSKESPEPDTGEAVVFR